MSLLLTNFSVKIEGTLQSNDLQLYSMQTINNTETIQDNKIIVYNIEKDFLLPMTISTDSYQNQPDIIKLDFYFEKHKSLYGDSLIINKNDIYYENTDSFENYDDLCQIHTINELTILYNISINLTERVYNFQIGDIFAWMDVNKEYDNETYYIINNLFKQEKNKIFFFNYFSTSKDDKLFNNISNVISNYFAYNCYNWKYYNVIKKAYSLILNNIDEMRFFLIAENKQLFFLPIFNNNNLGQSNFFQSSILFNKDKSINNNYFDDREIKETLNSISKKGIIIYYYTNKIKIFIDELYSLCSELNNGLLLFRELFSLIELSFDAMEKGKFAYSNIVHLLLFKRLLNAIPFNNNNSRNCKMIILCNTLNTEEDSLLNEAIRQQFCNVLNEQTFPLVRYINFYFKENIDYYILNMFQRDRDTIEELESKISFSFKFPINEKYKSIIINSFASLYSIEISRINSINFNSHNAKHLWYFNSISPIEVFDEFVKDEESIPNFFFVTHLTEYVLYQKKQNRNGLFIYDNFLYINRKKIIRIQSIIKGRQIRALLKELVKKKNIIIRAFRKYYYTKMFKCNNRELFNICLNKNYSNDPLILSYLLKVNKHINCLQRENKLLKKKVNNFIPLYSERLNISNSNKDPINEEALLKKELNDTMFNYNQLVLKGEQYIKQMSSIISAMNNNKEIKLLLSKIGIEFK